MIRCSCTKNDGQQCTRDASEKLGQNQQFCWQHQKCVQSALSNIPQPQQNIRLKKQPIVKKKQVIVKKKRKIEGQESKKYLPEQQKFEQQKIEGQESEKYLPQQQKFEQQKIEQKLEYIVPDITEKNYDIDWRHTAISTKIDNYYVIIVPAGTILYKGVTVKYPDNIIKEDSQYYSSLNPSMTYSFGKLGEHGKVIIARLIKDITLFDVSQEENFHKLREAFEVETLDDYLEYKENDKKLFVAQRKETEMFPQKQIDIYEKYKIIRDQLITDRIKNKIPLANQYADVLKTAFTDGKARYSEPPTDRIFSRWACQNLGFDGWGLIEMKNAKKGGEWHNEMMICYPSENVERLPYEFRLMRIEEKFDIKDPYQSYYIYLTKDGTIVRQFPIKNFLGHNFTQVFLKDHYEGEKNKMSDKYLFTKINQ